MPDAPVLVPPELVACPAVAYPEGLDAGPVGVDVLLDVDEHGGVASVAPIGGPEPFAALVAAAVVGCTFTPALEDGVPVPVELPFHWDFPTPPVNVSGHVVDPDGLPLAGVAVTVADRSAETGLDGGFSFRNVAPGAWTVHAEAEGLRIADRALTLAPSTAIELDFTAFPITAIPEAVGAYRVEAPATVYTLDADAIAGFPGTMGDPIRALAYGPGLTRTPFDAGWLLVRGGGPGDTGVYLDGVRIPVLFHLGGLTSVLDPALIAKVELVPGAFSARHGEAVSGVAEVTSRPAAVVAHANGGVNLAFAHAFAEVPAGHGSLAFAARRSYLDGVLALVLDPQRAAIAPRFWDAEARWASAHTGALALVMSDAIDAPTGDGDDTVTILQQSAHAQGRVDGAIAGVDLAARPWIGLQRRTVITDARDEVERESFAGASVEAGGNVPGSALIGGWDLAGGVDGEGREFDVVRDGTHRAGWLGHADPWLQIAGGDRVRFDGSVRLETLFVPGALPRAAPSPRGSLRWRIGGPWSLSAEAGRLHEQPSALFLVAFDEGDYMRLERSDFASVGARWQGAWTVDVAAWRRWIADHAAFEHDGSFGAFDGRAWGVEGVATGEVVGTTVRFIGHAGRTVYREERGDLWAPDRYDQPLLVQILLSRELGKGVSTSLRWRYGAGYPRSPTIDSVFDILTQTDVPLEGEGTRLPAYHALDLRIDKEWTFRRGYLKLYLDVQDVYGRRVPEPAINGIDDTFTTYGYGLPVLPIFGVEGGWQAKASE
jgi:hypothetical protein